jgi:cis-3-alkyl-4-acyloxetan-2-one decarboxylase
MALLAKDVETLYPFTHNYLPRDGYRLHYLDEGSGAPLVMLHGNPTWSFLFRRFAGELRTACRVVVPDHAGCGLSDTPSEPPYRYTLDNRVADLAALLDFLGLDRHLTLFLHDWGGLIGLAYAARYPNRIRRLVIFNTAGFLLPEGKRLHWTIRFCRNTRLGALLTLKFNAFARVAFRLGCRQNPMPGEVRGAYTAACDSPERRNVTLRFVQDIPLAPADSAYETVRRTEEALPLFRSLPVLICWGERDFVFDRDFLAEWSRRFPKAEIHRFPQAGHYVLEEAFEDILPLVRSFLARNPVI